MSDQERIAFYQAAIKAYQEIVHKQNELLERLIEKSTTVGPNSGEAEQGKQS